MSRLATKDYANRPRPIGNGRQTYQQSQMWRWCPEHGRYSVAEAYLDQLTTEQVIALGKEAWVPCPKCKKPCGPCQKKVSADVKPV